MGQETPCCHYMGVPEMATQCTNKRYSSPVHRSSSPVGSRQALYRMASLAPGAALVSVVSGWKQKCS